MNDLHGCVFDPENEWVARFYGYGQDINARQIAMSALKKAPQSDGTERLRKQLKNEIDDLVIRRTTAQIMAEQRYKLLARQKGSS